jgi:tetratricopeptide (TPR) repeat protein
VPALVLMANLELLAGHSDKALAYAIKVQQVRPDLYIGFELAGDALMKKKDYVTAKTNYEQAWKRKSFTELVVKRSQVLLRAGKLQASVRPLLDWLADYPDDVRVLLSLGEVFQRLKQNGKAIEVYEKVLKMRPKNVTGANNLAWLYSLRNNPRALELAERAYRLRPEDGGIQDTYGWILVKQARVDEGLKILEKAIKVLPNTPEVQYHYAVALLRTGHAAQAKKILGNLLESSKSFEGREDAENLLK